MNKPPNEAPAAARRAVLRRALAVGCGMWAPVLFSGCDKKEGGTAPSGGTPSGGAATEGKKAPKASVRYQTSPKGEQQCSTCANFIAASNTCQVVEGEVSPEGWCSLWVKKA